MVAETTDVTVCIDIWHVNLEEAMTEYPVWELEFVTLHIPIDAQDWDELDEDEVDEVVRDYIWQYLQFDVTQYLEKGGEWWVDVDLYFGDKDQKPISEVIEIWDLPLGELSLSDFGFEDTIYELDAIVWEGVRFTFSIVGVK